MTVSLLSGKEFTERLNAIAEARLADHRFGVSALAFPRNGDEPLITSPESEGGFS